MNNIAMFVWSLFGLFVGICNSEMSHSILDGPLYLDRSLPLAASSYFRHDAMSSHFWAHDDLTLHQNEDSLNFISKLRQVPGNDSDLCWNVTMKVIKDLQHYQVYALNMADAFGKPPSGILKGAALWLGSYDECLETSYNGPDAHFKGKYCLAAIKLPIIGKTVETGLCVPDVCSNEGVAMLIEKAKAVVPVDMSFVGCQPPKQTPDSQAIAVISVFAVIGAIIIAATLYDEFLYQAPATKNDPLLVTQSPPVTYDDNDTVTGRGLLDDEEEDLVSDNMAVTGNSTITIHHSNRFTRNTTVGRIKGMAQKCLLCFSLRTNGAKLLNTSSTSEGTLHCVHGIRFFSMTWVILGHTFALPVAYIDNLNDIIKLVKGFAFAPILSGTLSVDTFFLLSGMLVSYLLLNQLHRQGGVFKVNWLYFYFHRFWRLSPPYFLLIGFYTAVLPFIGEGPIWPSKLISGSCADTWWRNILYSQNIAQDPQKQCFAWAWYLACDMQFFVVAPLFIVPLYLFGWKALPIPSLGVVGSCLAYGLIVYFKKYPADIAMTFGDLQLLARYNDFMENVYFAPWCRIQTYLIGVILGFILSENTRAPFHLKKVVVCIGWILAAGCCFSVVYSLTLAKVPQGHPLSWPATAVYATVFRSVWACGVAWVIFACVTGYGGYVNSFLSWSALTVVSRLTYMAYLVHPIIMYWYWTSLRAPFHATYFTLVWQYFAFLVASYGVAFVTSLSLESPMLALEKAVLK